jgi:hypothetical protein
LSTNAYFFDDASLTFETDESSPTTVALAGLQEVEIIPSVSIEQLYTGDSIKIDSQKQHEFSVDVTIGFSKWDQALGEQWLGGSGGTTATSMTDTTDPQKFNVNTYDPVSVGGGNTINIKVEGITFEEMPLAAASRGEYEQWDLNGTGEDITDYSSP